jgi:hypothetical protein
LDVPLFFRRERIAFYPSCGKCTAVQEWIQAVFCRMRDKMC